MKQKENKETKTGCAVFLIAFIFLCVFLTIKPGSCTDKPKPRDTLSEEETKEIMDIQESLKKHEERAKREY